MNEWTYKLNEWINKLSDIDRAFILYGIFAVLLLTFVAEVFLLLSGWPYGRGRGR